MRVVHSFTLFLRERPYTTTTSLTQMRLVSFLCEAVIPGAAMFASTAQKAFGLKNTAIKTLLPGRYPTN